MLVVVGGWGWLWSLLLLLVVVGVNWLMFVGWCCWMVDGCCCVRCWLLLLRIG